MWTVVFAANLMVPLPLGLLVLSDVGGQVGMLFGVVVTWAAGLAVCSRGPRITEVLVYGGWVVAVLQTFPLLQGLAGLVAAEVWGEVVGRRIPRVEGPLAEVRGFTITLLTAQPLLLAALVFGGGHRLLFGLPDEDAPHDGDGAGSS